MKKAFVAGTGVSGLAAARLLVKEGYQVVVADASTPADATLATLAALGVVVRANSNPEVLAGVEDFELAVISPAFADTHPWVVALRRAGVETISELELACRRWPKRVLAITGSKGKSSIVKFCADALNASGINAVCAGNYGLPLTEVLLDKPEVEVAVVEVSSFQMELTESFSPDAAILLNLQADHLDRHGTMEAYRRLKMKLFDRMKAGALAVFPSCFFAACDLPCLPKVCFFGDDESTPWRYQEGKILGPEFEISISGSWFDNPIFGVSLSAACAALIHLGVSAEAISAAVFAFLPLPHRMQSIWCSEKNVKFIDDSKATSLSATAAALSMVQGQVRLIAGGLLKEKNLDFIKEMLVKKVKKVYLIGNCAFEMAHAWDGCVPCEICATLEGAVLAANAEADANDVVLLSPGTASFDQFKSYRERGERFAACVRQVAGALG